MEDVDAAYIMNRDLDVSAHTGDGGVVDQSEIERRIREDVLGDYKKYGFGRFAVELKSDSSFIGFAGLKYLPEHDAVDLGYRLMKKHWGKGYATEAAKACIDYGFGVLGLNEIIAFTLPENSASIHVLNKLNFQFEKEVEEDGQWIHRFLLNAPANQKKPRF